ncbi:hypothetical protein [Flavobacterium gilvum]|uniref:DUF4369 domain-containing protein n=1 Tax=Flavobacterium gilvum TaxID=1492737 RepID=A0AAC9I450_9FLAO|nr:hypothetical protein [Flavobacterium gilvum]AOW08523.1 hypothetical protein EM308_02860 [Flavobacterium gilvum]KFC58241.1 hypothetical protein FEM08_30110 [Flavobacterium gilvum]
MKLYPIILAVLITGSFTFASAQKNKTIIKGKVHRWPTDTIYLHTLPFHSPYSGVLKYKLISKDSTFNFQFENTDKPFVFFITSQKKVVDQQTKGLLFDNLAEEHYWSNCFKIYTYGKTTNLIEPNEKLDMDITWNGWNKTDVSFKGPNKFKHEYYQKSFDLSDKEKDALKGPSSENIEWAISDLKNVTQSSLDELKLDKDKLGPVFYDYLKAEIEFGARKFFLQYLWSEKVNDLKEIIATGKIPDKFVEILAFNKYSINDATLISEEYNEFVEEYANFLTNIANKEYKKFNPFSPKKVEIIGSKLPEKSAYYYIANQCLLIDDDASEFIINDSNVLKKLAKKIIVHFPNGELNSKLREKYKID